MLAPMNTVKSDKVEFYVYQCCILALLGQTMIDRRVKQLNFNQFCGKTTLIDYFTKDLVTL